MTGASSRSLLDGIFGSAAMQAIFGESAQLQAMLDFEAALAAAQARCGLIPEIAAATIARHCDEKFYDRQALAAAAASAGNLAIPLVRALTERVAAEDELAAGFVHWGATSQDVIDSALMLQLRAALQLMKTELTRSIKALTLHVERHGFAVMAGRTWLQQAVPITFGLKAAGWLDGLLRQRSRLTRLEGQLVLQFGGASGTLASLRDDGLRVRQELASELGLVIPDIPWHAQRDRILEFAGMAAGLVASLGKLARDVALLMQTEVAEVFEPGAVGRGGSSTMPHKRNPVACAAILACATRTPGLVATLFSAAVQEHERGLGGWQAEWEVLPELCRLTASALEHAAPLLEGLEVDAARMRANLELLHGLNLSEAVSMELARHVGRARAHELVEAACRLALAEKRTLADVLAATGAVRAHLDVPTITGLLDPLAYLGASRAMMEAVLARSREPS